MPIQRSRPQKTTRSRSLDDQVMVAEEKVEEVQSQRKVRLEYRTCCGCGCSTIDVYRYVDADSDLENGDSIDYLEDDDVDEYGNSL